MLQHKGLWGVECTLAVIGTGKPHRASDTWNPARDRGSQSERSEREYACRGSQSDHSEREYASWLHPTPGPRPCKQTRGVKT
eukprot:995002-Pyramimonas_sp.AAC.1